MTDSSKTDLAAKWASDLSTLAYEQIPIDTIESIKLLILDSLGTALAASRLGDGRDELVAFAESQAASADCSLVGLGGRGSILTAAFVNGALVHALNYDAIGIDGGHVGLAAVPLPLALAEQKKSSGRDLLVAVCAGAEFTCRLAAALHRAGVKHENRFLEGQVLGYFGATAAAGRLLGFDPLTMHNAFGLALMQASGSRQVSIEGGAAKALYGGFSNLGAAIGIALVSHGIEARCSFLEGEAGLYNLFFGGNFERSVLAEGLQGQFMATRLAFKPWPISSVVQPFVEAVLALQKRERIDPGSVKHIELRTHSRARTWIEPFADRCRPKTAATASNSIPFCVAKALAEGSLGLKDFSPGPYGIDDPVIGRIAESISYSLEMEDTATGKGSLIVELHSGRIIDAEVIYECDIPKVDTIIGKFRDCARFARQPLANATVDAIVERVMALEKQADIATLIGLLDELG